MALTQKITYTIYICTAYYPGMDADRSFVNPVRCFKIAGPVRRPCLHSRVVEIPIPEFRIPEYSGVLGSIPIPNSDSEKIFLQFRFRIPIPKIELFSESEFGICTGYFDIIAMNFFLIQVLFIIFSTIFTQISSIFCNFCRFLQLKWDLWE